MFEYPERPLKIHRHSVGRLQGFSTNENFEAPVEPKKAGIRQSGICKWFNHYKFWGFIESEGRDVFIHGNDLIKSGIGELMAGQKVSFEIDKKGTKLRAVNVRLE